MIRKFTKRINGDTLSDLNRRKAEAETELRLARRLLELEQPGYLLLKQRVESAESVMANLVCRINVWTEEKRRHDCGKRK